MYMVTICLTFLLMKIDLCHSKKNKNEIVEFQENILKNYDRHESPLSLNLSLPVKFFLSIRDFHVDYKEELKISGDVVMGWLDQRLAWDPTKILNKTTLIFKQSDIWQPVPTVIFTIKPSLVRLKDIDITRGKYIHCSSTGSVISSQHFTFSLPDACISDFKNWPHDVKNCSVSVGFPYDLEQNINISSFYTRTFHPPSYRYAVIRTQKNREWVIYDSSVYRKDRIESVSHEDEVVINLNIKRNGSIYGTLYFQPCIVSLCMTLAMFWMDSRSAERIVLIGLLLMLHCGLFTSLSILIPPYGSETPFVMTLITVSFISIIVLTLVTVSSRKMLSTAYNPAWLQPLTSVSVSNPILSSILFLNVNPKTAAELGDQDEEGSLLITNSKKLQKQWQITTQILNATMFIVLVPISLYLTTSYLIYM